MKNNQFFNDKSGDGVFKMISDSAAEDVIMKRAKEMMWSVVEYKEMQMLYACAIKEIETKLEVLNLEFKVKHKRNPISSISSRLKSTDSLVEKMMRYGCTFSIESIETNINDIAGVRVICSYVDDIYSIAETLLSQDDVTLIAEKDYIKTPKPNGYRSLHLIVSVPVFLSQSRKDVKVEVQIRTIAMDYWASLEHHMKYKKDIPNAERVSSELRACADTMAETDRRMLMLRRDIELAEDIPTEEEELIDRFTRIGLPI